MKRSDKFAGILVAVLLAGGMLAGCGKENGSVAQNTVTSGNHVMETEQEKATEPMKVPSSDDVQETHKESEENGEETKSDGVEETTMALTDSVFRRMEQRILLWRMPGLQKMKWVECMSDGNIRVRRKYTK